MCKRERAASDAAKRLKAERIVEAAESIWLETGYDAFRMQDLADALGMAKGTIYLYFETKEEVFLSVYERMVARWFAAVDEAGATLVPSGGKAALAKAVTDALLGVPGLLRLAPLYGALLEKNVRVETLRGYKARLAAAVDGAASTLAGAGLGLTHDDGVTILTLVQSLAAGLYPLAEPGPIAKRLLAEPGLESLRVDFEEACALCVEACLEGLAIARGRKGGTTKEGR